MPLVILRYKPRRIPGEAVQKLAQALPAIVAEALDIPENKDARLTPGEVEVWVEESHKFDSNPKDLQIVVFAHDYPERRPNLEVRKNAILGGVGAFLSDYDYNASWFVWVLLSQSAYGENPRS